MRFCCGSSTLLLAYDLVENECQGVSHTGQSLSASRPPAATARGLVDYLTVKTLVGKVEAKKLSPSSELDKLQHAVLLNTAIRKSVEALVGQVIHSEAFADLPDALKAESRLARRQLHVEIVSLHGPGTHAANIACRLAAMNVMSRQGFNPDVT